MATARAKRLVKFLEREYAWTCRTGKKVCPKCDMPAYGSDAMFCQRDGERLRSVPDDTFDQVEAALIYALKE